VSILLDAGTRVLVQGITGREGSFHTELMLDAGTHIVAGVTPGHGGEWVHGVPVFDTVREAMATTGAEACIGFVPARSAVDAIYEAATAGIRLIVSVTEGVPVHDVLKLRPFLRQKNVRLIGPNTPGIITPGQAKLGTMPTAFHMPGNIGVVSRSSTLTYEVVASLTKQGIGQSTVVGIGADYVVGTGFVEILEMFNEDPDTEGVVLIGEIGGTQEQLAAEFIGIHMSKPVVAYIAGLTAPLERRIGHPGAIVDDDGASAEAKIESLKAVGVRIAQHPAEVPALVGSVVGMT